MKSDTKTREKPISLAPLSFEEVIQDVLRVKPESRMDTQPAPRKRKPKVP